MRIFSAVLTLIVLASVSFVVFNVRLGEDDSSTQQNTFYTDVAASRDRSLLDQFMATLDPTIMNQCVKQHDERGQVDLDYLSKCGDFDIYARYTRLTKFEAVKKFEYVLLHSSSKLEFEDRLAR